mmetsp:Transcript_30351/g.44061  ORF Transcript_30351/g.44061 Transcript_30351/m.44061 type:complete len:531 (+) Transcript_30351:205-1797(+)
MSSPPNDDSDLEDLLSSATTSPATTTNVNIDLDHLTRDGDLPKRRHYQTHNPSVSPLLFCYASCCSFAYASPCTCVCLVIGATIVVILALINVTLNPTTAIGVVQHDYTNVQSSFQLSMGNIDHWCIKGDDDSCTCDDPLEPIHRGELKMWRRAHKHNMMQLEPYVEGRKTIDVAIVGESMVELMDGSWMGETPPPLMGLEKVFGEHFDVSRGGDMDGVALGIAGDTSPNVLWRLQHGEMPMDFNPKIWWIVTGMNDLARTQCSEEVTVIGILRTVEEILERKPNAQIVLNSLFPMVDIRGGANPTKKDMEDAFRERPRGRWWRRDGNNGKEGNKAHYARDPKEIAEMQRQRDQDENGHHRHLSSSGEEEEEKTSRKREKINPKLKDSHMFRHRNPFTMFAGKASVPMWPAVIAINAELEKFCQKHDRVHFFDATSLFVLGGNTAHETETLNSALISNKGRMNMAGFKVWEDSMKEKLKYMLAKFPKEELKVVVEEDVDDYAEEEEDYDDDEEADDDTEEEEEEEEGASI